MSRRTMAVLGAVALGASLLSAPTLAGAEPPSWANDGGNRRPVAQSETGSYVVLMDGDPLVVSEGREGVQSGRGKARGQQMRAQHARAAADAGVEIVNQYTVALHGFSGEMSHQQAEKLAARDDVRVVMPDVMRQPTTDSSPEFLGLTGPGGAWDTGYDGEGIVVGVIDTGIWPEHPSFDDPGDLPDPPELDEVTVEGPDETEYVVGTCEFGNTEHNPEDAPFECNDKLVGARQMLASYRTLIGAEPTEFDSARDDDGHGTHTASTAAGNADVEASVGPHDLGTVSGIAPRAHVVAYKGLGALGGFSSDLAAAIDQAVADGVDVINYSIGGGPSLTGVDDIAFLVAADEGIHVATSAGNSGPGAGTIGGPASVPWVTSVGASTQSRFFSGTVVLGNGAEYVGASLTDDLPEQVRLVDAEDVSKDGSDLCIPGSLIRGQTEGAIVLCRRGAIARVDKSLAVAQAGGVGMVMYENSDAGDRFTDTHHVPSVHVDNTEGLAIKAYIDEMEQQGRNNRGRPTPRQATAAIVDTGAPAQFDAAPSMTSFSSRGHNPVAEDLIKPDVTAPGMQILAGASPYADPNGNLFQSIAGTSMSSPHVAGLMALLDQAHPEWSPAALKSALMTTAHQDVRDNDRTTPADPFEMGAGHVAPGMPGTPGSAFDPGLVYDAGYSEYAGFICAVEPGFWEPGTCELLADDGVPISTTDLNVPSIGMSAVPGSKTATRTVTNVADTAVTYTASVEAPDGFDVAVEPASLALEPGESASFTITLDTTTAPLGEWRFGSLTWEGSGYSARSPIAAKAAAFDAPSEVDGSGESGSVDLDVAFGYTGEYTAGAHGLEAATVHTDAVAQDPDQTFQPSDVGNGAVAYDVTVSGSALLRIAIPPDSVADPDEVDIDLFVHDSAGNEVASSTNGGTDELVDLVLPADDTYTIYVHGWQTAGGPVDVTTYVWDVSADPAADDGSLSIDSAPPSATLGDAGVVEASWTGATAGQWYLGAVSHSDADGLLGLTLVDVDNR